MAPSVLQRIRRNHAIEHAALHLLARTPMSRRLAARSDGRGLTFYGEVDSATLSKAINGGLLALSMGQNSLAIHRRCGSMLSIAVLLGLLAAWLAQSGFRRGASTTRRALTLAGVVAAALVAQPLGEAVQRHVLTDADTGRARLVAIYASRRGPLAIHRATIAHT